MSFIKALKRESPPSLDISTAQPTDEHSPESRARWDAFVTDFKALLRGRARMMGMSSIAVENLDIDIQRGDAGKSQPSITLTVGDHVTPEAKTFLDSVSTAIINSTERDIRHSRYGNLFELVGTSGDINGPRTLFETLYRVLEKNYLNPRGDKLRYPATLALEDRSRLAELGPRRDTTACETPRAR